MTPQEYEIEDITRTIKELVDRTAEESGIPLSSNSNKPLPVNELAFNADKLIDIVSIEIFNILKNFIANHVLSTDAGYNQVDGTFAIFQFNKTILARLANADDIHKAGDKYRSIFRSYAMNLIQSVVEKTIE